MVTLLKRTNGMNAECVIESAFRNAEMFSFGRIVNWKKWISHSAFFLSWESARRGCDEAAFVQSGQRQRKPNLFSRHLIVANLFGAILRYDKCSTETMHACATLTARNGFGGSYSVFQPLLWFKYKEELFVNSGKRKRLGEGRGEEAPRSMNILKIDAQRIKLWCNFFLQKSSKLGYRWIVNTEMPLPNGDLIEYIVAFAAFVQTSLRATILCALHIEFAAFDVCRQANSMTKKTNMLSYRKIIYWQNRNDKTDNRHFVDKSETYTAWMSFIVAVAHTDRHVPNYLE